MRLLVDTHAFIWMATDPRRLSAAAASSLRDPFDRMLIAQARVDGLTVVTRDGAFAAYEVSIHW